MPNEIKAYVLGKYGRAPGTIDEAVKEKILKNNLSTEKESNTYLEAKERCLAQNMSQEDMLIYVTFPQLTKKFFAKEEDNPAECYATIGVVTHKNQMVITVQKFRKDGCNE